MVVAVKAQQVEIVKLPLNYGADINLPEMKFGNSLLGRALKFFYSDDMN